MPNLVVDFDNCSPSPAPTLASPTTGVTQEQINKSADATAMTSRVHVDPERAKDGPFGAPIAHGFLTLSLIIPFWGELFDVDGVTTKVNYGLDKVRFTSPVKVGSRIRMRPPSQRSPRSRAAPRSRSRPRSRSKGPERTGGRRRFPRPLL